MHYKHALSQVLALQMKMKADPPLVKCPLLAIHGDQDEFGLIEHPKLICNFTGGLSQIRILQQCEHVPHREKTEDVLSFVVDFLQHNVTNCSELNSTNITLKQLTKEKNNRL